MNAHNIMEEIVQNHLDEIMAKRPGMCGCGRCIDEIMSIVLSNLPAKYITTDHGAMYALIDQVKVEQSSEILKQIIQALDYIKEHPVHEQNQD